MEYPLSQPEVDHFKLEIEKSFGRRVLSSRDCNQLSEELFIRTGNKLNPNTLRRFFGLVRAEYPPSKSTLNVLAQYCGYSSYCDIEFNQSTPPEEQQANQNLLLRYLVSLFASTPVNHVNDETYMRLVRHTINYLKHTPELIDKFQRAIAKTKNGQEFYFEQFINIDKLDSYYGDGLHYYMTEKKTLESIIWSNSILCFRYWLTDNPEKLDKHFQVLREHYPDHTVHPFVCARYFAAALYHAEAFGLPNAAIIDDAKKFYDDLKPAADNYRSFPCFEYLFSEGLVLTGEYDEALFYIRNAFTKYRPEEKYIDRGFFQTITLCKGIALAGLGHTSEAQKIYSEIKPHSFYFLSKQYNMILLLDLCIKLRRCTAAQATQLSELIEETGFVKFRKLVDKALPR